MASKKSGAPESHPKRNGVGRSVTKKPVKALTFKAKLPTQPGGGGVIRAKTGKGVRARQAKRG